MMWSSSPVCARPVRTFARSFLSDSRLFFIFCSAVFLTSGIMLLSSTNETPSSCAESYVHHRALVLAQHHALQSMRLEDAEYVDGELLVAAQRERGRVHDLQVLDDRFVERELLVAHRVRVRLGVVGVDAVDLGGLQHELDVHL